MRQDFFEHLPQFKVAIVGNHGPELRNIDDAIRRRFRMVGFDNSSATPDPRLQEKLAAEMPGILRSMINGCLDWQEHGLITPVGEVLNLLEI